jgi:histidinol-phosphate aminotransferase
MKTARHIDQLSPYIPIEPFEVLSERYGIPIDAIVKMDANENPYGPSPRTRHALASMEFPHIYPDPESRALRKALEGYTGVPAENIMAGAGADELIDLLLRVLLEPEDVVLNLPPTFGMYPFDTLLNTGRLVEIQRREDFSLNLPAILAAVDQYHPKVIFATHPNNPDGRLLDQQELDTLFSLPAVVVIDEAYIEFAENGGRLGESISLVKQVPMRENLVVLRTFSKWAGLAGLRVGYGVFPGWIMPALWKAKQPYNVNVAASTAAIASIQDADYLAGIVARLRDERSRLFEALKTIPFLQPCPSQSNFILCKVVNSEFSAAQIKDKLAACGILLRLYNTLLLRDYVRVSVGKPEHTDILMAALREIMNGNDPKRGDLPGKISGERTSRGRRITQETQIEWALALDGSGKHQIDTGLPFLDHMLTQIAIHGLFDLVLKARGDLHIDPHHTMEDVALALGQAFQEALGSRSGIVRMATMEVPMDESLARVTLDFSGRPYAVIQAEWHAPHVGGIPTSLFAHFLESFATQARCNLHVEVKYGRDDHHQAEAIFKALARALNSATRIDPRRSGTVPSSKGVLF